MDFPSPDSPPHLPLSLLPPLPPPYSFLLLLLSLLTPLFFLLSRLLCSLPPSSLLSLPFRFRLSLLLVESCGLRLRGNASQEIFLLFTTPKGAPIRVGEARGRVYISPSEAWGGIGEGKEGGRKCRIITGVYICIYLLLCPPYLTTTLFLPPSPSSHLFA